MSKDPVLPGTEKPRSLGDLMREVEQSQSAGQLTDQATDQAASQEHSQAHSQAAGQAAGQAAHQPAGQAARKPKKTSRTQARRFARERALQALYQWDVSAGQSSEVRQQFLDAQDMSRVDVAYFTELFNGISHNPDAIDEGMLDALDRPIADLDPIERGVLRVAVYELMNRPDIPARVVINEGVEITKRFGADKGHRYVNGVLDKLAHRLRPNEIKPR